MSAARDDIEWFARGVIWRTIWYALVWRRLYHRWRWASSVAAWALPHVGGWAYSPRAYELQDRREARRGKGRIPSPMCAYCGIREADHDEITANCCELDPIRRYPV